MRLVAEALGLAPDGLARFYDAPERMQHRSKVQFATAAAQQGYYSDPTGHSRFYQIVKYPTRDQVASEQGVGPHFDAGFLTFVSPPHTASFYFIFWCLLAKSNRIIGLLGHKIDQFNSFRLYTVNHN